MRHALGMPSRSDARAFLGCSICSQIYLLITMKSHGTSVHKMNTGKGQQDPKSAIKVQVSYRRSRLSKKTKEIRRAGEQTSPQVARVAGHNPVMGRGAADRAVAAARSAVVFPGQLRAGAWLRCGKQKRGR